MSLSPSIVRAKPYRDIELCRYSIAGGLWISMPPVFPVEADFSFVRTGEAQVAGKADTLYFLSRNARE